MDKKTDDYGACWKLLGSSKNERNTRTKKDPNLTEIPKDIPVVLAKVEWVECPLSESPCTSHMGDDQYDRLEELLDEMDH